MRRVKSCGTKLCVTKKESLTPPTSLTDDIFDELWMNTTSKTPMGLARIVTATIRSTVLMENEQ